jgi:lipoprotein-anchoring transpeptidase ErfK/SrfK
MLPRALPLLALLACATCAAPAPPAPSPPPPAPVPVPPEPPPSPAVASTDPLPPAPAPSLAPPPPPPRPRLTSRGLVTWIYGRPKADDRYIGYIRNGSSVTLRATGLVHGEGCAGGFYLVEPRGYVCNDHTVTLAPSTRFLEMSAAAAASPGPLPFRYAFSDGAPMYNRVPTPDEQRRAEHAFGPADSATRPRHARSSYQDLTASIPIEPTEPMPPFLQNGGMAAEDRMGVVKLTLPSGSMVSFTRAFAAEGRTWLLSAEQTLVPADRVRAFRPSTFHGVHLGADVALPLAWMRATAKRQYHRLPSGEVEETGRPWPVRTFVRLAGASIEREGKRFLETRDHDADGAPLYLAESDATVAEAAKKLPTGVKPGQKWILVSITDGTLVAYEGLTPVYATLVSPGRGGVPSPGGDAVDDSTTPLGTYNITFKDRATTMSPDKLGERSHWIADVPHTQYFKPPFALHAAYWHERFGEPASAGCVNVSPLDAELLFDWSDPPVPPEWQGATGAGAPENGAMTAVVVRR